MGALTWAWSILRVSVAQERLLWHLPTRHAGLSLTLQRLIDLCWGWRHSRQRLVRAKKRALVLAGLVCPTLETQSILDHDSLPSFHSVQVVQQARPAQQALVRAGNGSLALPELGGPGLGLSARFTLPIKLAQHHCRVKRATVMMCKQPQGDVIRTA